MRNRGPLTVSIYKEGGSMTSIDDTRRARLRTWLRD